MYHVYLMLCRKDHTWEMVDFYIPDWRAPVEHPYHRSEIAAMAENGWIWSHPDDELAYTYLHSYTFQED